MDKPDLSVPVSSTLQDKFRFGWKWFIDLKTYVICIYESIIIGLDDLEAGRNSNLLSQRLTI